MDIVCFGTLGGSATRDAKPRARPHERHSYHDLARSHGVWEIELEFAAAVAGPIYTLLGVSVLFLASLLLARRLSINLRTDLEEKVSGFLSGSVESGEETPIALGRELFAA